MATTAFLPPTGIEALQPAPKWQSAASAKKSRPLICLNTLRALDFFVSLHFTIFEQAANFEFFNSQLASR
jgi:hypothetical protein